MGLGKGLAKNGWLISHKIHNKLNVFIHAIKRNAIYLYVKGNWSFVEEILSKKYAGDLAIKILSMKNEPCTTESRGVEKKEKTAVKRSTVLPLALSVSYTLHELLCFTINNNHIVVNSVFCPVCCL